MKFKVPTPLPLGIFSLQDHMTHDSDLTSHDATAICGEE